MSATWEAIKGRMSSALPKNSFSLWIDPITASEEKDKALVLGCPNKFSRNWVMENYLDLIKDNLSAAGAGHLDLVFKIQTLKRGGATAHVPPRHEQLTIPKLNIGPKRGRIPFHQGFTFDRFIVGRCNEFAYSASKALAHGCAADYRSLMMLANTGLGKTHLSQAIGNEILTKNPSTRVYYITAEDFANEMISALKGNSIEAFKNKYRRCCDVLLIDEVHFLSGKKKTQSELGYTLDALSNHDKKIIFTSSLAPKDMPSMSGELSSRLTSGLVTTIERPDYDTRVEIIKRKASEQGMVLSDEIVGLLAGRLKRDVRQMECALNYLKAKSELLKARIDLDMAKDVLNCLVSSENGIAPADVSKLVCRYYKVEKEKLCSKSRKKIYAHPRNIYVYLCRRYTDATLERIAKTVNRSHSAVLYATEVMERKSRTDRNIRHQLDFLGKRLEEMNG
jgi:chromosomal replication initiator protein